MTTAQTTFLLIRHGLTDAVGRFVSGTAPGLHLNDEGRRQVEELGRRLAATPLDAIVSSPLGRTRETADAIARGRGAAVEIDDRFLEVDAGAWTGRTFAELDADPDWQRYSRDRSVTRPPGGEPMIDQFGGGSPRVLQFNCSEV